MTTDIVERLRMQAIDTGIEDIAREAADVIERLQAELHQFEEQLAKATSEIAFLRSANANRE